VLNQDGPLVDQTLPISGSTINGRSLARRSVLQTLDGSAHAGIDARACPLVAASGDHQQTCCEEQRGEAELIVDPKARNASVRPVTGLGPVPVAEPQSVKGAAAVP
jgi:hypothetical protein